MLQEMEIQKEQTDVYLMIDIQDDSRVYYSSVARGNGLVGSSPGWWSGGGR